MIALLRAGAFFLNLATLLALGALFRLSPLEAAGLVVAVFAASWWACSRAPRHEPAEGLQREAEEVAHELGAPPPRFAGLVDGWTAGAVLSGLGYGLIVGREVRPEERRAVLAHEIAHAREHDLVFEPFTDGFARLCLPAVRFVPPIVLMLFPILILGVPLARATELRSDRVASRAIPTYPIVLKELARRSGARKSLLYPPFRQRLRQTAWNSMQR